MNLPAKMCGAPVACTQEVAKLDQKQADELSEASTDGGGRSPSYMTDEMNYYAGREYDSISKSTRGRDMTERDGSEKVDF